MRLLRLFALFSIFSAVVELGCAGSIDSEITLFDALITRDVIAEEFEPSGPLDFSATEAGAAVRRFSAEYLFDRRCAAEHYTVDISVAAAGHFLDPSDYKIRRDSEAQGDTPSEADYPSIGMRARRELFGVGPGGAAYGLTFTTSNGQYDVRIIVSNLLPDGIEEPRFDLDGFARRLAERYDAKTRSAGSKAPKENSN